MNKARLVEILILSGMPERTENLRYLGFNRQVIKTENRTAEFSAIAVINNHRADKWRLEGYRRKLSRLVFDKRWTRNPLDIFINNLRCSPDMMNLLAASDGTYTLLGMLSVQVVQVAGERRRTVHHVRPVIAVSGIDDVLEKIVAAFEEENEIRRTRIKGLPFHREITRPASGDS
ncbi:MAG: hypothetical protein LJE94_00545 [Deltaproteobacteria bacterium]|nr:hypothetical protein [Deltaproteobacteria bacterium]